MANIFADIKTPYVNEATLKRVMSSRVKENIFQGIFTRHRSGADSGYQS